MLSFNQRFRRNIMVKGQFVHKPLPPLNETLVRNGYKSICKFGHMVSAPYGYLLLCAHKF